MGGTKSPAQFQLEESKRRANDDRRLEAVEAQTNKNTANLEITHWINAQQNAWHNAVRDTEIALSITDNLWSKVINAKEQPSVFGTVLTSLITTLLPIGVEFAMFAGVLKIATMGDAKRVATLERAIENSFTKGRTDALKNRLGSAEKSLERTAEKVQGVKEVGVHLAVEGSKSGSEASEARATMSEDDFKFDFKLNYLEQQWEQCSKARHSIDECARVLLDSVDTADPKEISALIPKVKEEWRQRVGLASAYKPDSKGTLGQLARILLYDMLRRYCATNVHLVRPGIKVEKGVFGSMRFVDVDVPVAKARGQILNARNEWAKEWWDKPQRDSRFVTNGLAKAAKDAAGDIEFENLKPAQRKTMYDIFREIDDLGPSRPLISNWEQLIEGWEFASDKKE